jgi:hypothetical protein
MNLQVLQILFFSCIPIGIFLFVKGIKMVRKFSNKNILMEMRLSDNSMDFAITKSGRYAVWVKAPVCKRNHLDKVKINIYNQNKQKYLKLWKNIFATQSNNGSVGQSKYLSFKAQAGNYKAELSEGTQLRIIERMLWVIYQPILRLKEADINECFFQVRENTSPFYGLLSVLTIILGVGSAIAGFVLGLLTETIWK